MVVQVWDLTRDKLPETGETWEGRMAIRNLVRKVERELAEMTPTGDER